MTLALLGAALAGDCATPVAPADVARAAIVVAKARETALPELARARSALRLVLACAGGPLDPLDAWLVHAALDPVVRAPPGLAAATSPGRLAKGRVPAPPRGAEVRVDGFAGAGLHAGQPALVQVIDASGAVLATRWVGPDDVDRFLTGGDLLAEPPRVATPRERRQATAVLVLLGSGLATIATATRMRAEWEDDASTSVTTMTELRELQTRTNATWTMGWVLTGAGLVGGSVILVTWQP